MNSKSLAKQRKWDTGFPLTKLVFNMLISNDSRRFRDRMTNKLRYFRPMLSYWHHVVFKKMAHGKAQELALFYFSRYNHTKATRPLWKAWGWMLVAWGREKRRVSRPNHYLYALLHLPYLGFVNLTILVGMGPWFYWWRSSWKEQFHGTKRLHASPCEVSWHILVVHKNVWRDAGWLVVGMRWTLNSDSSVSENELVEMVLHCMHSRKLVRRCEAVHNSPTMCLCRRWSIPKAYLLQSWRWQRMLQFLIIIIWACQKNYHSINLKL